MWGAEVISSDERLSFQPFQLNLYHKVFHKSLFAYDDIYDMA